MQVSSTKGFFTGQWVRLWVQQPTRPSLRRSLLGREAAAAGGTRRLLQRSAAGSPAGASGYLPLSEAAAAASFSFASEAGDDGDGDEGSGQAALHRPAAASAGGTLDAHLYGENAVDSGSGACWLPGCLVAREQGG